MDIFGFSTIDFMSFVLTFMRISLIVFLLPFFGGDTIPVTVKAAVTLVLTFAIWPHTRIPGELFPSHPASIILMIGGELVIGMSMGLLINFVFAGIQTGGQIIGFQMGFSMITLADPSSGQQLVVTSFLSQTIAMMIFLTLDGHLFLLYALTSSFNLIMPGQLMISGLALGDMIKLSSDMFVLALKVAGPIVACLYMVELALALMAKVSPQMNLLTVGFPIKIGVGLFFMSIMFSLISMRIHDMVRDIGPIFNNFLRSISG